VPPKPQEREAERVSAREGLDALKPLDVIAEGVAGSLRLTLDG